MSIAPVIAFVRAHVFRCPIDVPVRSAIGIMTNRPMLLVQIEDSEGAQGWGEIWCNFPTVGAEHRARLVESIFHPLLAGKPLATPAAHFERLTESTRQIVIQTGEAGPFAQCIAGIDQALTDLAARRAGQPLWRFLGGSHPTVDTYASALGPAGAGLAAQGGWQQGYRGFKLKLGFGKQADIRNLAELRDAVPAQASVMVDANQAWSLAEALDMIDGLAQFDLTWIEEPISAEAPLSDWRRLAGHSPVPLAAGENLRGMASFNEVLEAGVIRFVQPDIGKWGGFTRIVDLGRRAVASGLAYCPHWLGGGIGLLASLHLLVAVGGQGRAEIDANPNPLRESVPLPPLVEGRITLPEAPGLGVDPDKTALPLLSEFRVRSPFS